MSFGPPSWRAYPGAPRPGTRLCPADEIEEGEAKVFAFGAGEDRPDERFEMLVLRWQGRLLAYVNDCPHAGTPLDWPRGKFFDRAGSRLMCATHGALFRPDNGLCTAGPCLGDQLSPVPIEVTDGEVVITWLSPGGYTSIIRRP